MNYSIHRHFQLRFVRLFALGILLLLVLPLFTAATLAHHTATSGGFFRPNAVNHGLARKGPVPPTDAQCRALFGSPCYSPQEIRKAYNVTPLLKAGFTGKGQTIVIIDSFGSPTVVNDLKVFDAGYGLPDPPSIQQLAPFGSVPFDPTNSDQVGWAAETSLDVQWSHAMAPDANIIVLTSPVSETQGVQGMPQFLALEQYALDHHLGKIISQSWGTTENTLFDKSSEFVLDTFEKFYQRAAQAHVSVFASSGDSGTANPGVDGTIYPFPTVGFPASSPMVTAVGGTSLLADTTGKYQSEAAWNGTGGGISQHFKQPDYQQDTLPSATKKLLKGQRGLPDIAYNADPFTGVSVYLGFLGTTNNGFFIFGGTSEGAPQWAGITAVANQFAHHPLGFLNPALYKIGKKASEAKESFHDITVGNNSVAGIPGYNAVSGWDPTTGWGTPDVTALVKELAKS